ncbi:MAG: cytochrome c-type biogenesis protein [Burkholderiaceae bacterium]
MRLVASVLGVLLGLVAASSAVVAAGDARVTDPAAVHRAAELAAQLRCLVCQNQTIADSNADLAVDLRRQIDEQIRAGRSDREIVDFMVARYGDFVLYRPPFKATTALLWLGPVAFAGLAVLAFVLTVRARRMRINQQPLTDAEHAEAARLIARAVDDRTPTS